MLAQEASNDTYYDKNNDNKTQFVCFIYKKNE